MINRVIIHGKSIGDKYPVYFEVDLGAKYYSLSVMKKMIRVAKEAGADAVKLQTYTAETISRQKGKFFRGKNRPREDQYDFFKKYQLSKDDHRELFKCARDVGITIFSTPCFYDDVDFLEKLDVPAYKISSGDCTNYPFLKYVAQKNKPVILSTGMANLSEIYEAVQTIIKTGNKKIIILHCTVDYPAKVSDSHLKIIDTLKSAFECPIGLSDHTVGTFVALLAAARGANFIEKHFCLDRSSKGPDSGPALEPEDLKKLTTDIKNIPVALGQGKRDIFPTEKKWRNVARKSIVSLTKISKGQIITPKMITIKRPGDGMHPKYWDIVVGRISLKAIPPNTPISWKMI